jgi:CcmD family protein
VYEFLSEQALYVVLIVVLVVWAGIYGYLLRLDLRLKKLEVRMGRLGE